MPKIKQILISQSELARRLNITRQAVSKLCKMKFKAAFVGKKLNLNHPIIKQHFQERWASLAAIGQLDKVKPEVKKPKARKPVVKKPTILKKAVKAAKPKKKVVKKPLESLKVVEEAVEAQDIPDEYITEEIKFSDIEDLTVRQVVAKHGGIAGFKLYIDALRGMADWKNKELKFRERRGELVEKNPLADTLFSLLDLSFQRIVRDFPGSMAPQLKAMALSLGDDAVLKMSDLMKKDLSQIIKSCKAKVNRELKNKH